MTTYLEEARAIEDQIIQWRRDFHRHPELRFEEHRTARVIGNILTSLSMQVQTGVGKTGVVGILKGNQAGPVSLMRFDMDALPIQEENAVEYASTVPGVMHACGHDGHTAIGLGVATLLARHRDELCGTVKFVFQPAEEGAGGAKAMIADGVLKNPAVDISFGVHIQSQTPSGTYLVGDGPILAAADEFRCVIHGKGGHGALPQTTVDASIVAAQAINLLQTIVSRNIDPLKVGIISIGSLHAGSAFNVIPETAEITGTIRTYESEVQALIHQRMREVFEGTARLFGATAEFEVNEIVPAAYNNPKICAKVRQIAADIVGRDNVSENQLGTPSDDIAEYLRAAPGCHFILGGSIPGEDRPHHSPRFNFNEKVLPLGVALFCEEAMYFHRNWDEFKQS
ncbi:amidohydrolase [Longilinea arvoryzae]|uniref:Amidohydrolase n=1 Tax=Longilinea arvoryzae TaxID=360412 RepID=A0A0S7BH99_9CHLR|nr:amidohydrolase [Longilinea arvoryzae]GAP14512.1 amidohydrolase [Longilinea arvoryzae]